MCRLNPSDGWRLKHRAPQPSFLFLSQFSCLQLWWGLSPPHSIKILQKKITKRFFILHSVRSRCSPLSCKRDATGALHCALPQSHSLYVTLPTPNLCPGAHLSAAALPEQRMKTRVWSRLCPQTNLCSPLWPTPRSCCSRASDVRRNGNTGTETQKGGRVQPAPRRTQSMSHFLSRFSK